MRLLLVSDLHYALPQLDWVVATAPEFDVVVLAGDHLDIASPVPLDTQSTVVLRYLQLLDELTSVVASSGNHDLTGPDAAGEQAPLWLDAARADGIRVDGATVELGSALITVCPWWDGPVGRAAVDEQLARDAARRGEPWVWVYHWPPIDSPTCWTGRGHYGDPDLAGWIEQHQPDVVLTGHVHESPFKHEGSWADRLGRTWVFNAGRQRGPIPARVELDLDGRVATWVSLAGIEEVHLDAASGPERTAV